MRRILIATVDFPYPPRHGAAVDMWDRLLVFKQLGFSVDLAATVRREPSPEDLCIARDRVENLWIVSRHSGISSAIACRPYQMVSRRDLRSIPLHGEYDAVLLESEHMFPILENPALRAAYRILRIHNDETAYFMELAKSASGWRSRLFYVAEAVKYRTYSARVKARCDQLWFISDYEMQRYAAAHPGDRWKSLFMPPGVTSGSMRSFEAGGKNILFIGSLIIPYNREAAEWFIRSVYPLLHGSGSYPATLAGRTDAATGRRIRASLSGTKDIAFEENPHDLEQLYADAAVFINPVSHGAGLKLKTIQALWMGIPVVTTSLGMQGTGLLDRRHLLVADTPEDFAVCIKELIRDRTFARSLVEAAQAYLARRYDQKENILRAMDSMQNTVRFGDTKARGTTDHGADT